LAPKAIKRTSEGIAPSECVHKYEIIIADSQSGEEVKELFKKKYPDIKIISFDKNVGYSKMVNAGINNASGDYLLVINHDVTVTDDAVDKMMDFMVKTTEKEKIGMIGPKLLGFNNKIQYSAFRFYSPWMVILRRTFLGKLWPWVKSVDYFLLKDKNIEDTNDLQYADWLMGSALLVSKEAINKVGLMDERFFMYFEDVDWARRFWENGYKVAYFPQASMYHYHGQASKKRNALFGLLFSKMARTHLKSAILFFLKYKFNTVHYV